MIADAQDDLSCKKNCLEASSKQTQGHAM